MPRAPSIIVKAASFFLGVICAGTALHLLAGSSADVEHMGDYYDLERMRVHEILNVRRHVVIGPCYVGGNKQQNGWQETPTDILSGDNSTLLSSMINYELSNRGVTSDRFYTLARASAGFVDKFVFIKTALDAGNLASIIYMAAPEGNGEAFYTPLSIHQVFYGILALENLAQRYPGASSEISTYLKRVEKSAYYADAVAKYGQDWRSRFSLERMGWNEKLTTLHERLFPQTPDSAISTKARIWDAFWFTTNTIVRPMTDSAAVIGRDLLIRLTLWNTLRDRKSANITKTVLDQTVESYALPAAVKGHLFEPTDKKHYYTTTEDTDAWLKVMQSIAQQAGFALITYSQPSYHYSAQFVAQRWPGYMEAFRRGTSAVPSLVIDRSLQRYPNDFFFRKCRNCPEPSFYADDHDSKVAIGVYRESVAVINEMSKHGFLPPQASGLPKWERLMTLSPDLDECIRDLTFPGQCLAAAPAPSWSSP